MTSAARKSPQYLVVDPCQISASYNYCLLDGLAKAGANVTYAGTDFIHEEMPDPQGITRLRCFFWVATWVHGIYPSRRLRQLLRASEYPLNILYLFGYILVHRIKVVHYIWSLSPVFDSWFFRLLQMFGCRVVYTAHNPFPHERKIRHERQFAALYRTVDHVIVLTRYTAEEIKRVCDLPEQRVSVVPHGDYAALHDHYECDEKLLAKIRKKARGRKVVAYLGLIRKYKGLDYFIRSFPKIQERLPDVFFLVAGNPGLEDADEIRKTISDNCQEQDVWVDLRFLPTEAMKAYLVAMDVLVMPYLSASQSGNTVMAYSAGVPVIATDVGGLAEMTRDNETGFVIPPKDLDAIAEAVEKCFAEGAHARLAQKAMQAAANEYSWAAIAEGTIAVYDGVPS